MHRTINLALLVDDNIDDQFFHARVIRKNNFATNIVECSDGEEAINYLKSINADSDKELSAKVPDIIFLDINMPKVNGFEFLEFYSELPDKLKKGIMIIMLSTSLNPKDQQKAENSEYVHDFIRKPLGTEDLKSIWGKYFSENE